MKALLGAGSRVIVPRSAVIMLAALLLNASGTLAARPRPNSSISVHKGMCGGVPVTVMTVDMSNPAVKVTGMVARRGSGSSENFTSMIWRSHPTAAVTGTFFCTRSLAPVGDIVVNGELTHKGGVGTGFCVTENNDCAFIIPPHRYAVMDWSQYDFVCSAGPRLMVHGKISVHPKAEGFHDSSLLGSASRLAVGLTPRNKLLFVSTRKRIQLGQMARVMKRLGCRDAINLDAGGSLGFYYRGKMLAQPNRKLTNVILIYDDRDRFERFKNRLTPHSASITRR